jgi:hypothetical protein
MDAVTRQMQKAKCGSSWNTVSGVAITMSATSTYSEWTVVGPLSAAISGTGMEVAIKPRFLADDSGPRHDLGCTDFRK